MQRCAPLLLLIALAGLAFVPARGSADGEVVPSTDVKGDIARIDEYRTSDACQDQRIPLMRQLAVVGGPEVTTKFISLLDDEFVHLREEAQDLLVTIKCENATEILTKQGLGSTNNEICRRAAEVLGARKAEDAIGTLLGILRGQRDVSVRCACAAALEAIGSEKARRALIDGLAMRGAPGGACARALGRLGETGAAARIEKLLHDKDGLCVVGAADGLGALGADAWVKNLCRAADHKDYRARIAIAQALGRLTTPEVAEEARDAFSKLIKDDDWRVRRRSIEALIDLWQPLCVELLVARLPVEKGCARYDLVHALEDLTGERKGYTAQAWDFYWTQNGKQRGLADRRPRPEGGWLRTPTTSLIEESGEGNTTVLFDVPVLNLDTAFVVETTGTMNSPVGNDGRTRFSIARDEIQRVLAGMNKASSFNIVTYRYVSNSPPFAARQAAFDKGVQPVTPENIKLAEAWLSKRDVFGLSAWTENVLAALEDPKVQVVYFINGGDFSRGMTTRIPRVGRILREAMRFAPVAFINIGLDMGYVRTEEMKQLTSSIGGVFKLAEWKK